MSIQSGAGPLDMAQVPRQSKPVEPGVSDRHSPSNPDPSIYREMDLDDYRAMVKSRRRGRGKIETFLEAERAKRAKLWESYQDKVRRCIEGEDIFDEGEESE